MAFTVDEIKRTVITKARAYGIKSVRLFGSYARGEANDFSDVDLLIDRGKLGGLVQ